MYLWFASIPIGFDVEAAAVIKLEETMIVPVHSSLGGLFCILGIQT
jgi:hypothetical protein